MSSSLEQMVRRHGKRRRPSFLDSSLRLEGIIDILQCTEHPITFVNLQTKSRICMKASFLRYLKYCVDQEFIIHQPQKEYALVSKGREFLELVKQ
jgi:predicted transcriptional regulator